jgi:ribose transport system substrate-binding protein
VFAQAGSQGSESASGGQGGASPTSGLRVDLIVKGTDQQFYQAMMAGAQAAGEDFGIDVGLFGPPSERDVDQQVRLVENSISRGVDAIALAPSSSDATNGVIDRAREQDMPVIALDNQVTTEVDGFIGTDNFKAGADAGQKLCELVKEKHPKGGKIFISSVFAGIQVLEARNEGFRSAFEAECPDYEILKPRYNNADPPTAASQMNDALTANPDLVGVFVDGLPGGIGVAQAIKNNNVQDEIPVVAFDSDPEEVVGLKNGSLDALVVQNPWFFGYQGVVEAAMAKQGRNPPEVLDPGGAVVEKKDLENPVIKRLVNPPLQTETDAS